MSVITENGGRTNIYAKEPQMQVLEQTMDHNTNAELLNGRLAMLAIIAAMGAYAVTGQIIPGLW